MNIDLMQTKPNDARVCVNRSNLKLSLIKKQISSKSNLFTVDNFWNISHVILN